MKNKSGHDQFSEKEISIWYLEPWDLGVPNDLSVLIVLQWHVFY